MQAYRIKTVVIQNGAITIKGLPVRAGEKVDVIILSHSGSTGKRHYSLRDKPVRYLAPFASVAENDWEVIR